jgi:hypothetical protein
VGSGKTVRRRGVSGPFQAISGARKPTRQDFRIFQQTFWIGTCPNIVRTYFRERRARQRRTDRARQEQTVWPGRWFGGRCLLPRSGAACKTHRIRRVGTGGIGESESMQPCCIDGFAGWTLQVSSRPFVRRRDGRMRMQHSATQSTLSRVIRRFSEAGERATPSAIAAEACLADLEGCEWRKWRRMFGLRNDYMGSHATNETDFEFSVRVIGPARGR